MVCPQSGTITHNLIIPRRASKDVLLENLTRRKKAAPKIPGRNPRHGEIGLPRHSEVQRGGITMSSADVARQELEKKHQQELKVRCLQRSLGVLLPSFF